MLYFITFDRSIFYANVPYLLQRMLQLLRFCSCSHRRGKFLENFDNFWFFLVASMTLLNVSRKWRTNYLRPQKLTGTSLLKFVNSFKQVSNFSTSLMLSGLSFRSRIFMLRKHQPINLRRSLGYCLSMQNRLLTKMICQSWLSWSLL